jgi:hypothetical protein
MSNVWFKFKIWSKVVVFSLIGLYVLLFIFGNKNLHVDGIVEFPFLVQFDRPRLLTALLITAIVSIVGWWLLRTILKTVRQLREMRERGRATRLEKELAQIKAKAGMLQTRDAATPTAPATTIDRPAVSSTTPTPNNPA